MIQKPGLIIALVIGLVIGLVSSGLVARAQTQTASQGPPNALQGFSQNRDQPVHIEAATLEERALIVDMSLSALLDGEPLPLDFDFRSLADGTIEYRVPLDAGSIIAGVGGDRVLVRASNGTFDCQELDCSRIADSGEL